MAGHSVRVAAWIIVATTFAFGSATQAASAQSWSIEASPSVPGATATQLSAVSCPSASFCVAAGSYGTSGGGGGVFAELWNGVSWSVQKLPVPTGSSFPAITGVSCPSASFCLAIGWATSFSQVQGSVTSPLVEMWNGNTWTAHTIPTLPEAANMSLDAVACLSSSFCEAVGSYEPNTNQGQQTPELPLAEQWNGAAWTPQTSFVPTPASQAQLSSVSCTSQTECTAVGIQNSTPAEPPTTMGTGSTYAARWNGAVWTSEPTTDPPDATLAQLLGVSCVPDAGCSAVGSASGGSSGPAVADAWNGVAWALELTPQIGPLNGVSCAQAHSCVAVGGAPATILQWDGKAWSSLSFPVVSGSTGQLFTGISCPKRTDCTAVGYYDTASGSLSPVIERYS